MIEMKDNIIKSQVFASNAATLSPQRLPPPYNPLYHPYNSPTAYSGYYGSPGYYPYDYQTPYAGAPAYNYPFSPAPVAPGLALPNFLSRNPSYDYLNAQNKTFLMSYDEYEDDIRDNKQFMKT